MDFCFYPLILLIKKFSFQWILYISTDNRFFSSSSSNLFIPHKLYKYLLSSIKHTLPNHFQFILKFPMILKSLFHNNQSIKHGKQKINMEKLAISISSIIVVIVIVNNN